MTTTKRTLQIYVLPTCSTCRQALKQLKEYGYELEVIDITKQPPSAEQLRTMIPASGLDIKKWFNVSGEAYRAMGLKDRLPAMNDEEKRELLSSNGMLIKRPVLTDGLKVTVGYKPELYEEEWG